jgi:hypothetical protein
MGDGQQLCLVPSTDGQPDDRNISPLEGMPSLLLIVV